MDDPASSIDHILVGGSEMAERMRAVDWAATPLGPVEQWPQSLRSAVSILLPSKAQIVLFWGPDLITLYNDAYRPVFGGKHPWALGRPARECWNEVWDVLQPLFDGVMRTGEAFHARDHLFYLERHGFPEETYFDVSYDPVRDETGDVGGVFCIVSETTGRVLGERRLRTLRALGADGAGKSVSDACTQAGSVLAQDPGDIPFALLFVADDGGQSIRLVESVGVAPAVLAVTDTLDLTAPHPAAPLLREVVSTGKTIEASPAAFVTAVPATASPSRLLALPLLSGTQPVGLLVAGVSRHLALGGDYRDFFDLVAARVSTAIATIRAYEEERRRAEALAELDRAKTTFFGNVSHEFRTPLTLLLGPLDDLLRAPSASLLPADRERITLAHRNALRLLRLVNSLLDFSRIEAGRLHAAYELTDVGGYTADLASAFRSLVERAGLRFTVDCPPASGEVFIDREMWEKVVFNLLSNAFKHTFDGEIRIAVQDRGPRVELVVSDTGTGIAPHELPHIFERFRRVENARARTHEGTGIGLALVAELARLHGGTIDVTSEVERGTTFVVSLPKGSAHLPPDRVGARRAPAAPGPGARPYVEEAQRWTLDDVGVTSAIDEPGPTSIGAPGARVLLADDNADMREYLRRLLGRYWSIEAVADGAAALEAARREPPDLVLTDVMMPGVDGFALLRALRAEPRTRTVPVLLLSARAGEESRVEGLEAGADDYLVKPFSARELIARVNAHLEMAAARRRFASTLEAHLAREQAARAEADAANRAKDRFLAVLSHELRTPLSAILGWTRILRSMDVGAADRARAIEVIERNAERQALLVNDLLDVSRIAAGKVELARVPINLVPVVRDAMDALRAELERKRLRLRVDLDATTGEVLGDELRLQQIVQNLLTNAVKFTPEGGAVGVRLTRQGEMARLIVTDSGQGIEKDALDSIFEPFQQGDSSGTSRSHQGLGLGLTIVRQLVQLHGGTVRADSAGRGRGASFTVELPLMAVRLAPTTPDATAKTFPPGPTLGQTRLDGLRVLVVDDLPDARELVSMALDQRGARTRTAGSFAEALDILAEASTDVLVSDLAMPGADGYALIGAVRADERVRRGRRITAIALTAYAGDAVRDRAVRAGFDAYATKPVDPADLIALIAKLTRT
jgi:signal transduction histidine kinase